MLNQVAQTIDSNNNLTIGSIIVIILFAVVVLLVINADNIGNYSTHTDTTTIIKEVHHSPSQDFNPERDLYERLLVEKDKQISQALDEVYFNREVIAKLSEGVINNLNMAVKGIHSGQFKYTFDKNNNMYLLKDDKRLSLEPEEASYVYYELEGELLNKPNGPKLLTSVNN